MKYEIESLGGNCPVQGYGKINGLPFYFRARYDCWSFSVAATPEGDPLSYLCLTEERPAFYYEEDYKEGEIFAAGWMSEEEARDFIAKAAALFEAEMLAKQAVS